MQTHIYSAILVVGKSVCQRSVVETLTFNIFLTLNKMLILWQTYAYQDVHNQKRYRMCSYYNHPI